MMISCGDTITNCVRYCRVYKKNFSKIFLSNNIIIRRRTQRAVSLLT